MPLSKQCGQRVTLLLPQRVGVAKAAGPKAGARKVANKPGRKTAKVKARATASKTRVATTGKPVRKP